MSRYHPSSVNVSSILTSSRSSWFESHWKKIGIMVITVIWLILCGRVGLKFLLEDATII